ncbi:hypothetical protein [Yinghuangia aomiensis]|uniref:hypothetical protein n=1 Tax=Yinghuangia aomiensis TaxID=676205 RepID=UPI0031F1ACC3
MAGKAVEATRGTASATPSASGSAAPAPSGSAAKPALAPADDEALRIARAVRLAPTAADGGFDEAEAGKYVAEPMLSILKANWKTEKAEYRAEPKLPPVRDPLVRDPLVYRTAPSANGDRWFMVVERIGTDRPVFVFRSSAEDPVWKLALFTYLVEDVDGKRFLGVDEDASGAALTVASADGLSADPAAVCAQSADATPSKTFGWGPNVAAMEANTARQLAADRKDGFETTVTRQARSGDFGPVWRYGDGGAIVACVRDNHWTTGAGKGSVIRWRESSFQAVTGPDFAVTSYTATNTAVELVWIPPKVGTSSSKPDVMATDQHLTDFTFKAPKG